MLKGKLRGKNKKTNRQTKSNTKPEIQNLIIVLGKKNWSIQKESCLISVIKMK